MSWDIRQIGNTDVKVTSMSFGCASIGNLYREVNDIEVAQVLQAAWEGGIRYFDTAPHYGRGLSEVRLGAFLRQKPRDQFVVSTKVGRVLSPGKPMAEAQGFVNPLPNDVRYDYSADGIAEALEGSRMRLGTRYMDIVYVHDIGEYTHGAEGNAPHLEAFLGSGYEYLVRLKERGEIGAIGLGVNENEICLQIMDHCPLDVILLAGRLTLLDRSAEDKLVPRCVQSGTTLVLGGIFNSGILATGAKPGATYNYEPAPDDILSAVKALEGKAKTLGLSLADAALLYAKHQNMASSVLLGTAKASTLVRNLTSAANALPQDFDQVFA